MRGKRVSAFVIALLLCVCTTVNAASVTSVTPVKETASAAIESAGAFDVIQAIGAEKGKVVVVNFFATWCPPCREEIPDLIDLRKQLSEDNVAFFGVSMDESREELVKMVDETPFNYKIFHGNADVAATFNISGIPRLLIYDKQGKLAVDHTGLAPREALESTLKELMEQ